MKRFFFIYSMPRSGSAWLSQFLSQPGSFCFHEPLADDPRWDWLMTRMEERPEPVVGAIDTSAYMRSDFFEAEVKPYYLYRPLTYICRSIKEMGPVAARYNTEAEYAKCQTKVEGLPKIHWAAFQSRDYLETLWTTVTGLPSDLGRIDLLMDMRTERTVESVQRRVALASARGSSMYGRCKDGF